MEIPVPESLIQHFEKIFIDIKSLESPVAKRAIKYFPKEKIEIVHQEPWSEHTGELTASQFDRSKRNLFLTPFAGQFFKRCPGATQKKTLTCCNYYVLNLGSQCNMNCSYCYLQSYLNSPVMKIYTNIDQALNELGEMAEKHSELPYRVGTGEIIDSLSLDEITLYSRELIEFFRKYPRWTLEFKTKSNRINQFLDLAPAKNVVVSWSINPPEIINSEEHGTARFEERIYAAKKCAEAGFSLAFHIDPIIWHPNWKENYSYLVKILTKEFSPEQINVISLGTLRFQPEQRHMMRERFGLKSYVTSAEMFSSEGGKLRYDAALRNEMFQFVKNEFYATDSRWNIFLCMETPETWIQSFEKTPMQVPGLKDFFRPLPAIS
ncbi:MAG: radical SAM protein [Bdellovibrionota bacterium]